jgi:alkylation response protein AidB-like acyl-CoA dehydrogenase
MTVDLSDTPEQEGYRNEVRAWLDANKADAPPRSGSKDDAGYVSERRAWQRRLAVNGLAGVTWPREYGGQGLGPIEHVIASQELARAGVPGILDVIGVGMLGRDEQKARYLGPLLHGDEVWCQLFSEPAAGSDLAAVQTRALPDGLGDSRFTLNGQKVWTTNAQFASFGLLLARTNPDVPKHAGLTQFVLDMRAPGVEVRPLRQMTGAAEFNEVFLTGVRIPDAERLGEVDDGWRVSQHTLVYERYNMPQVPARGAGLIALAVAAWRARPDKTSEAARALRGELMRHWVELEVVRLLQMRAGVLRSHGTSGPEGSLGKLAVSRAGRRLAEWAPDLLGPAAMLLPEGYESGSDPPGSSRRGPRNLPMACVASPGTAIAGGTDQIQRNIIGDRVLSLPREPAVDRGLPWSQTWRN